MTGFEKYPDTARGARKFLRDVSSLPHRLINSGRGIPDPYVSGVWMLEFAEGDSAIVYGLGGPEDEIDFEISVGAERRY